LKYHAQLTQQRSVIDIRNQFESNTKLAWQGNGYSIQQRPNWKTSMYDLCTIAYLLLP
jgi:hypothetical protein